MLNIRNYAAYSRDGQDWTEAFIRAIEDMRERGSRR